jgi:hypothetical protein
VLQVPLVQIVSGAETQWLLLQFGVPPLHLVPQPPQFSGSDVMSWQVLAVQLAEPAAQQNGGVPEAV